MPHAAAGPHIQLFDHLLARQQQQEWLLIEAAPVQLSAGQTKGYHFSVSRLCMSFMPY